MAAPNSPDPLGKSPEKPAAKGNGAAKFGRVPSSRRVSVSEILTTVNVSKDEFKEQRRTVALLLLEIVAIVAVHVLLLVFLKVPTPVKPLQIETNDSGQAMHVWLQVRPQCWALPDWPGLLKSVRSTHATGKSALVGEGPARYMQLDGVVDEPARAAVSQWASSQANACLAVTKGKEEYQQIVRASWTPTTEADFAKAAATLLSAGATVTSQQWEPTALFILESLAFPERSLQIDTARKALASGGLKNFVVEPTTKATLGATAHQRWQKGAIEPFKKVQRGAIAIQMVIFALLAAIWMVVLRGRFANSDDLNPLTFLEGVTRGLIGAVLVGVLVALIGRKIGIDFAPLQARVAETDAASSVLSLLSLGLLWPLVHGIVLHGYVQRRLAQTLEAWPSIAVAAIAFPLCQVAVVPLVSPQVVLWLPVAALAGFLAHSTGRLGPALVVTAVAQFAITLLALF
ncbi:MAG: hypothetical protein EXR77_05385 [Myxococcales bacterium]|nr:hypothetical protein [Myxococcales bacterium]